MSVHYLSEGGLFRRRSLGISPEGNASVAPQMLKWESPSAHRLTMGKFSAAEVAKGVDSTSSRQAGNPSEIGGECYSIFF